MEENNNYYATNSNNNFNQPKSKLIEMDFFRQIAVIATGWLGLRVFATLIAFAASIFLDEAQYKQFVSSALFEFIAYLGITIIICLVLGKVVFNVVIKSFTKYQNIIQGLVFGAIMIGAQIIYNIIKTALFGVTDANTNENEVESVIVQAPILSFFFVVIFAPFVEETTYRLGLFGLVNRYNRILAFVVSSLVFGLLHFDFSAFTDESVSLVNELINLPSYLISGFILAYAYDYRGNLSTSITAHATNNGLAFFATLIASISGKEETVGALFHVI